MNKSVMKKELKNTNEELLNRSSQVSDIDVTSDDVVTRRQKNTKAKTSKKSKKSRNALLVVVFVCAFLLFAYLIVDRKDQGSLGAANSQIVSAQDEVDPSAGKDGQDLKQKTGVQIERRIREIILIPEDVKVFAISYINTDQALKTLQAGKNSLLKDAKVGDYYVVFEDRAILYRDSENKMINYAPIIRQN